jgi:hypothetical protein
MWRKKSSRSSPRSRRLKTPRGKSIQKGCFKKKPRTKPPPTRTRPAEYMSNVFILLSSKRRRHLFMSKKNSEIPATPKRSDETRGASRIIINVCPYG